MDKKVLTVEEALKKAEYYCAYQERCHQEVVEKLKTLGMFDTAIDYILNELLQNNFLNEERFAVSFGRGKHKIKGWGKHRIEQELKAREISKYNIQLALKEIEPYYLETFYELSQKKWDSLARESEMGRKRKFTEYFFRKGFETSLIYDRWNELQKNS